jgi:hypothetical protein
MIPRSTERRRSETGDTRESGLISPAWNANRPVRAYLPADLDLDPHMPSKWHPYAKWVVSGLYLRHHVEAQVEMDDFRPTHSKLLKRILPERDYAKIMGALVAGHVIEQDTDYKYRAGFRSQAYRLAAESREGRFRSETLTHRELVPKVHRYRADKAALVTAEVHRRLREHLTRLRVTDDYPVVSLPLTCIRDGELFFTVDPMGRVHTPITNLGRGLRQFVRYGDHRLEQVDVSNSQALLLALTIRGGGELPGPDYQAYAAWLRDMKTRWFRTKTAKIPYLPPPEPTNRTGFPSANGPLPYVSTYTASSHDDFAVMRDRCLAGEFFETLLDRVLADPARDQAAAWTRRRVKDEFWVVAYAHPAQAARTDVGRAFRSEYPDVWAAITRFYFDHGHGELPRRMQTVESYVCVWRACSRIIAEFPDAPLLTLHDCLLSDAGHVGAFAEVLADEYRAVFGVAPRLTTKPF